MDRNERVTMLLNIRGAVYDLLKAFFNGVDDELKSKIIVIEGCQYIKASEARLSIRSIRAEALSKIYNIGKLYEPEQPNL